MDHGVINSQPHVMVWTFYSVLHVVYSTYVVSVPGIVNFTAQLQLTNINVTWQVSVVRIIIL